MSPIPMLIQTNIQSKDYCWKTGQEVQDMQGKKGLKTMCFSRQRSPKASVRFLFRTTCPVERTRHSINHTCIHARKHTCSTENDNSMHKGCNVTLKSRSLQTSWFGTSSVQWREKTKMQKGILFYCASLRLYHLVLYSLSPELAATAWSV